MKILCLIIFLGLPARATSYAPLELPDEPSPAMVLEANKLKDADETTLLEYIETHWDSAAFELSEIKAKEVATFSDEYSGHIDSRDGKSQSFIAEAFIKLQEDRLHNPRRIVDAALRELGKRGTGVSLPGLMSRSKSDKRPWVGWKALASVQEILPRADPSQLDHKSMMQIDAVFVAPLFQDLDPVVADRWAWALWEHHKKWMDVTFPHRVPLLTRILLAGAFVPSHPVEAGEVFEEGLRSHDPALRTVAEMVIRSGIGGSLAYGISAEKLLEAFKNRKWTSNVPAWEAMPLPLGQPLLRGQGGGRWDLVWLNEHTEIIKQVEDVTPDLGLSLPNGLFYSNGEKLEMIDTDRRIHAKFPTTNYSTASLSAYGGVRAFTESHRPGQFFPDGTLFWDCPFSTPNDQREFVGIGKGRVVFGDFGFLECRDRRGDLLWRTPVDKLGKPREIIRVSGNRFLLACQESIGWLTTDGNYEPILTELGSGSWIRYHPTEPWIIMDGATTTAIIYDPVAKKEIGRFDLHRGSSTEKSRFPAPRN